jgi:hypothetical protein
MALGLPIPPGAMRKSPGLRSVAATERPQRRLGPSGYTDRQIMDLATNPREERVEVEHKGQRHLIDFRVAV